MIVSSTLTAFRHHPLQKTRWWWYVLIPFHQRPSCHYHRASFDFCWIISNVFVTNDDICLCNVTFGLDRRAAVWCGPELYEHMAPNISPNRPWSLPRVTCALSLCIHLSRLSWPDTEVWCTSDADKLQTMPGPVSVSHEPQTQRIKYNHHHWVMKRAHCSDLMGVLIVRSCS